MTTGSLKKSGIKAIILGCSGEFYSSNVAPRLPAPLWPVAGQTVLERLLRHLADEGVKQAVICSNDSSGILCQSVRDTAGIELKSINETLPLGTAGSIREAAGDRRNEPLLVVQACMVSPPSLDWLWKEHQKTKAHLTLALNPLSENIDESEVAGVYICEPSVLEYIPEKGYCDIKETLIPTLIADRKKVHAVRLPKPVGNFRKVPEFLAAVADYLDHSIGTLPGISAGSKKQRDNIYLHPEARVDPTARIIGPAVIMEQVTVSPGAVLAGPCIVEADSRIGAGSLVSHSVLWPGARIGKNCEIQNSLLDRDAKVPDGKIAEAQYISPKHLRFYQSPLGKCYQAIRNALEPYYSLTRRMSQKIGQTLVPSQKVRSIVSPGLKIFILFAALIWSYRATLGDLWNTWSRNDEYSSGLLVPFLAAYLVWSKRAELKTLRFHPALWGIFIFLGAQLFRCLGLFLMYGSAERLSLVVSIAGLVLFVLGWQCFRKLIPILLFLVLMLPLPRRIEAEITLPLQRGATSSAVFCLELFGYDVTRQGNVIHIQDTTVAVAEACNGLRMVTAFFVISGLVVLLVKRFWWEKLILLLSTLPIALLCNTIRLTITAIVFTFIEGEYWEEVFHDFGGYAMMPLALGIVVLELWLLVKLTTPPQQAQQTKKEGILVTQSASSSKPSFS